MEIKQKDNGKIGSFYIEVDGNTEAEMTYKYSGDHQITIDHTEVNSSLKGLGVGYKLIEAAVAYLRENNLKAIPQCPFAKSVFDKKGDEFKDIRV